eukprot:COSAG06_NODE_19919_length_817_cov_4.562674_2_plen_158_part_00
MERAGGHETANQLAAELEQVPRTYKMGPLDAVIQLLLFVCFGVYVVMGLTFLIMGIIYHSDEGAVGSTGIYLILLGLLMLIIGGIAVFANLKKIWLILFVIELVNVALFLVRCWLLSALCRSRRSRGHSARIAARVLADRLTDRTVRCRCLRRSFSS